MTGSEVCEGCCEVIYDRFVMRVGNSPWHEDCLFCSECHAPLANSCYYKEGRLLCRGDYERRFGVKCGRCGQCLMPHDLVMRTRFSIYHIACFACTVCSRTLNRGDQYVVRAGQVRKNHPATYLKSARCLKQKKQNFFEKTISTYLVKLGKKINAQNFSRIPTPSCLNL